MNFRPPVFRCIPMRSKLEARTLIALLLIAGTVLLFAGFVNEVVQVRIRAFDEAVLFALRDPINLSDPVGPAWLQIMFRDITSLGGYAVVTLITLAVIGYLLMD